MLGMGTELLAIAVAAVVLVGPGASPLDWWRARKARIATEKSIEAAWPELTEEGGRLGALAGETVVIEFGDYECPFCKASHPTLTKLLGERPDPSLVYRHLPLTAIHPSALGAARASVCAEDAGRFQEMHDFLYETDTWKEETDWAGVASAVGVRDVEVFVSCLESATTERRLGRDALLADKLGINSTPTFVGLRGIRAGALDAED